VGLILYGAGSQLIVDVQESCARAGWRIAASVRNVDGPAYSDERCTIALDQLTPSHRKLPLLVPVFTPELRRIAVEEALRKGFANAATLIDPTAVVASSAQLGGGCYINAGCVIGGSAVLGDFIIMNSSARVAHHCRVGITCRSGPGSPFAAVPRCAEARSSEPEP